MESGQCSRDRRLEAQGPSSHSRACVCFSHSCRQCPEPAPPTSGCYRNAPKLLATPTCPPRHQKGRAPRQWEGVGQAFPRECANLSHCETGSECSYHCTLGNCSGDNSPASRSPPTALSPHRPVLFPGSHPRQVTRRADTMVHQVLYRALVSTKWLAESIRSGKVGPSLRVLDASWYSPGTRQARKEYQERHVPGASFFDIEECRDTTSPYEMMLPSEAHFGDYVGNLGISNDTHVVVYDGDDLGSFYAPRVWWMFRVFGHRTVSVLNGGFRNWLKEGHPVTSEPSRPEPAVFKATLNRSLLKTYEQVLENLQSKRFQLVDSRAQGRYLGTQPEPDAVGRCFCSPWENCTTERWGIKTAGTLSPSR